MNNQKLSVLEKTGFGAGDMAVNVVISSMFLIVNYFYTDIFGLDPKDLILLFWSVRLIDAVTDPLMGMLTDRVKSRFGRYRPYFLYLSVPFGVSVVLMFTTPDFDYNGKLAWAYATYILVTLAFTSVTIPYISLIGVLTDNPKERLSANGYRLFFAKIAAFLVAIAVPELARIWGADDIARGYQLAMTCMGVIGTLLLFFCFVSTKERVEHVPDRRPFITQVRILIQNDQWMLLCGVCVVGTVGYVIRNSVAAYYARYYLGSADLIPWFMGTGVIAAILAMVASTWITKRFCKVRLFRWSQIATGVIATAMYFFVGQGYVAAAFVFYFVMSFVVDLQAPIFWSAAAEVVDYGHAKSGSRVSGLAFGGLSFCQKFGMGMAGAITNSLLALFAYQPDVVQAPLATNGIALMLTVIPGAFHVIMGGVMFKYRITDKFYLRMKEGKVSDLKYIPDYDNSL
ncbi:MAG: MFS transporter [Opitutales bacterium]|nr:MFS transporter [Opitutales bacterium]